MSTRIELPASLLIGAFLIALPAPARAQWSAYGAPVCITTDEQGSPTIVADGSGGAILAWDDHRNGTDLNIYAQRISAAGVPQWTPDGVAISIAANDQYTPELISDGSGGAIIAWSDRRNGTDLDIYVQHVDAAGVPAWTAQGVAITALTGNQTGPVLVSDGSGGAILTWSDYRSGTEYDIFAQRVSGAGAPQWGLNGVPVSTASNSQNTPIIVPDGLGGAIIAWPDYRNGPDQDIYAQRVNGAGVSQWTANGVAVTVAAGGQFFPTMAPDGNGGAIVTWGDSRSGVDLDIYAQRISAAGVPQWTTDGVAISTAVVDQYAPKIASDGAGGAIVAWPDYRGGTDFDIYAQRVNGAGVTQWTPDGVAISTAANDQASAAIVSDGSGGAIVTWEEYRHGSQMDLFAQRVSASGQPQWTTNGSVLSLAPNRKVAPRLIADGTGGAIVTWYGNRNGADYDIYAQRVFSGGGVTAVMEQRLESLLVRAPNPNPAHDAATISFDLPSAQRVSVAIYDVSGKLVRTLERNRELSPGTHSRVWNCADDSGVPVRPNIYFIRVAAGSAIVTRRVAGLR